jgi:hypothetical protein
LTEVITLQKGLNKFVEGEKYSHFGGMMQRFHGVPKRASINVRPQAGVELEGGLYRGNDGGHRPNQEIYDEETPFIGGAMLRAELHDAARFAWRGTAREERRAGIDVRFVCIHHDPVGGFGYLADSVAIPGDMIPKVDLAVVGVSPVVR